MRNLPERKRGLIVDNIMSQYFDDFFPIIIFNKDDLKGSFAAREKEINQQKKLDKVKKKAPSDRKQIVSKNTSCPLLVLHVG